MIKHLSPSSINLFINNYKQWVERYIEGKRIPENVYMAVGTAVHEFLEEFFQPEDISEFKTLKEYCDKEFNRLFQNIFFTDKLEAFFLEGIVNKEDVKEYLYHYVKKWYDSSLKLESKYGMSGVFKFNTPTMYEEQLHDTDINVKGIIDYVVTQDRFHTGSKTATFLLGDYKTSGKTFHTLHTDYIVQLMVYSHLFSRLGKKVDWVCIDYVKSNEKYFVKVTNNEMIGKLISDVWEKVKIIEQLPVEEAYEYKHGIKAKDYLK